MLPINKKISAYNYFNTNNIQYIVIHDVGAKSTAKNNVDYFSGGNRGASAHYFVDDTSIWQSVEDKHGAWHCGDGGNKYGINNQNSIGIEMCLPSGTVTAKTEQNTLELVKYLMAKYNVSANKVVRHYDASRKNCPGQFNLDGKWTRWNAFKAKLVAKPKPVAPVAPKPKPTTTIPKGFTAEKATFTVTTNDGIQVRKGAHGLNAPKAGILKKGQSIKYDSWASKDGYIWVHYVGNSGDHLFLPVRQVGKNAWGTFK